MIDRNEACVTVGIGRGPVGLEPLFIERENMEKIERKFKYGDVVKHKTGFQKMVVIPDAPFGRVLCSWINTADKQNVTTSVEYWECELELVPLAPPVSNPVGYPNVIGYPVCGTTDKNIWGIHQ